MTMVNAFGIDDSSHLSSAEQALVSRRDRVLGPAYRLFYKRPVELVRGDGVWLYDKAGEAYLDAYNNVASVGHCNPAVVEAVNRQNSILNTHTRYLHEAILDYAESLTATFPSELSQVMFTCSGSEANDLAVRVARHVTGGTGIIVTENAYHGVTATVSEFTPSFGPGVPLGQHVRTIPAPDCYRGDATSVGEQFADNVHAAVDDLQRHGIKPALLIVDTIFSSDGVFADPAGFLVPAVAAIRAAGGLFIADEVQAGFGRTGKGMWGFSRHGLVPDLVTIGKPMGNGYPIAAMIARPEILHDFGKTTRYFNTFGGNPVAIAAAQAVITSITQNDLVSNAHQVGVYLRQGLLKLQAQTDTIGDVRGAGLFIGVEMVIPGTDKTPDSIAAGRIVNALRERRVLISASGPSGNILKIRPPLVFSKENADHFLGVLTTVL